MTMFKLTFDMYNKAWHEDVQNRIKKIDNEYIERGEKPPCHELYYNAQFDDIPYINWENMYGEVQSVEFTI